MANQDVLFPYLPRNTQVSVNQGNLRVRKVEKRPSGDAVADDEGLDITQEARVKAYLQTSQVAQNAEPNEGQSADFAPPEPPAVAEDPRKPSSEGGDDYKGINLDTFA
ncbi:MAG: hypothetical protein C0463_03680 [Idiomarina sp.]|nr:hypothetical protein [Idiomarina sp.]